MGNSQWSWWAFPLSWALENLFLLVSLCGNCTTLSSQSQFQRLWLLFLLVTFGWSFGSTGRVSKMFLCRSVKTSFKVYQYEYCCECVYLAAYETYLMQLHFAALVAYQKSPGVACCVYTDRSCKHKCCHLSVFLSWIQQYVVFSSEPQNLEGFWKSTFVFGRCAKRNWKIQFCRDLKHLTVLYEN